MQEAADSSLIQERSAAFLLFLSFGMDFILLVRMNTTVVIKEPAIIEQLDLPDIFFAESSHHLIA
jgi:hypothetical protein